MTDHTEAMNTAIAAIASLFSTQPTTAADTVIDRMVQAMRIAGREELIHYAGASWRDPVAWAMVQEWCLAPTDTEPSLKERALLRASDRVRAELAALADGRSL